MISRDLFERRRLKVLNVVGRSGASESDYVLEDPALIDSQDTPDAGALRDAAISLKNH